MSDLDPRLSKAWQEVGYWRQAAEGLKGETERLRAELDRLRAAISEAVGELEDSVTLEEASAMVIVEAFKTASVEWPSCGCTYGTEPDEPADRGSICPHDPRGMSEVELLLRDYRADLLSGFGVGKEALPAQLQRASRVARIGKALDAAREDAAKRIDEVVGHCPKGPRADEEVAATKNHELWTTLALCLGFNELAKLGKTLGDKVYARLFRDKHVENLIALGGNGGVSPFADEKATVEIEMPAPMPWLRFRASDIELMRAVVAEHDAASPLPDPCENAFSGDDQMQRTNEAGTPKDWRAVLDSLGTTGLQTMGFRPEVIEKLWALREAEKRQQAAEEQPTGGAE